jgi:hypothetical protein
VAASAAYILRDAHFLRAPRDEGLNRHEIGRGAAGAGDLSFGDLDLKAGDFHVATPSSSHPPGRTVNGCLVHVIMSLDQH